MPSNIRNNPIAEKGWFYYVLTKSLFVFKLCVYFLDVPILMNRQQIESILEEFDAGVSENAIIMELVDKKVIVACCLCKV